MKTKLIIILSLAFAINVQAGSATWNLNPGSSTWGTASNWTPATVPNGPADTATFAVSNNSAVSVDANFEVNGIVFNPGASAFTITSLPPSEGTIALTISGAGMSNQSGTMQNFVAGANQFHLGRINFTNSATAGSGITYTVVTNLLGSEGTRIQFLDNSSAAEATFVLQLYNQSGGGEVSFAGNSTAANATFSNQGFVTFLDSATAANAIFTDDRGLLFFHGSSSAGNAVVTQRANQIEFTDSSTAANGVFTLGGGSLSGEGGATVLFEDAATAANGAFSMDAGTTENAAGSAVVFYDSATAGHGTFTLAGGAFIDGAIPGGAAAYFADTSKGGSATFTANGGTVAGASGATVGFSLKCTAGSSNLIANGGTNGGGGAQIQFFNNSRGGTSRIELHGNGSLDLSAHLAPGITTGSIEGDGPIFLGARNLTIGSNDLSTTFSGVIQDGGSGGGTGGSLSKVGTGVLTLTGANICTGGATVSAGAMIVSNSIGSGTGTGPVTMTGGTLGGKGTISGAVTVGTGSGSGAFLAPAFGGNKQVTLTLRSSLTLQADATYTYTFKARANQTRTDLVRANGVTINGATVALQGTTQGTLTPGTELTLIRNTSPNPIVGTFSNLANGAITTINGNNLQASYSGGDGNDLTLTVVP
jgi:hypothetical protein